MTTRKKLLACGVALALLLISFSVGRYSRPARVEVREHTTIQTQVVTKTVDHDVIQIQTVHDVVKQNNVVTKIEWRTAPDGSKTVTETTADLTKTSEEDKTARQDVSDHQVATVATSKTDVTKSTVTTNARPDWSVSLMPGLDVRGVASDGLGNLAGAGLLKNGVLGASVDRRILGGLFIGVHADTRGVAGLTARIEF